MDDTQRSVAFQVVYQFCLDNRPATALLRVATRDYAEARCLLLNQLFGGLVLGAQAMEKYLKAYILFKAPQSNVRGFNHSLPELLEKAANFFPQLSGFSEVGQKFSRHYDIRYPDNRSASTSMTTGDLAELDEFIIFLNENMSCPRNVKYRTGLYAEITFSLDHPALMQPVEFWIRNNNQALAPLLPCINADYVAVKKELFP